MWTWLRLGHLHSAAEYAVPLPRLGLHRRLKDGPENASATEKQFQKTFAFTQQPGLSWCQCMNGASPPRLSPEVVRVSPFPFIMATTVLFRLARSYGFSNMDYLSRRGDWLWSMQDDK